MKTASRGEPRMNADERRLKMRSCCTLYQTLLALMRRSLVNERNGIYLRSSAFICGSNFLPARRSDTESHSPFCAIHARYCDNPGICRVAEEDSVVHFHKSFSGIETRRKRCLSSV